MNTDWLLSLPLPPRVHQVMTPDPIVVYADTSLNEATTWVPACCACHASEAYCRRSVACAYTCRVATPRASLLMQKKIRRLPVVDSEGKLLGLLSRGNIIRAALAARKNVDEFDACMSTEIVEAWVIQVPSCSCHILVLFCHHPLARKTGWRHVEPVHWMCWNNIPKEFQFFQSSCLW